MFHAAAHHGRSTAVSCPIRCDALGDCGRGAGPAQGRLRACRGRRYNERSAAERVNGGLKDDFGGRYVRVRGHAKVFCHLMFGVLALAIDHLMRLIT